MSQSIVAAYQNKYEDDNEDSEDSEIQIVFVKRKNHKVCNLILDNCFISETGCIDKVCTVRYVLPVGHIQNVHRIKVIPEYTASSTLMAMATCVTLVSHELSDWSLVKISVKTAKFRSRGWQESFSSKIFQNLFLCSDDFSFMK